MSEDVTQKALAGPDQAPVIIWTLRRTGGTNLGASLFERSPFPVVQQEPFNEDRVFGAVTKAFRESGDEVALRASLREILARHVLIKHCVETIVPRLNVVLAEEAVAAGYRHVFLYRRHALGRLLSLQYAQRSGVWGKQMKGQAVSDDVVFAEPLPVEAIIRHEKECRRRLHDVFNLLSRQQVQPLLVAFEDIYAEPDADLVKVRLLRLLFGLHLSISDVSDAAFVKRVAGGEQGTRDKYSRFVNYRKFADTVEALPLFNPAQPELKTETASVMPDDVVRFAVWKPSVDGNAEITLAGVLLPREQEGQRLLVEDAAGVQEVPRQQPSPKLAEQFPDNAAAAHARYSVQGLRLPQGGVIRLLWQRGNVAPVELARITGEY